MTIKTNTELLQIQINNRNLEVNPEKTVLEAALENDIYIPNLCYDPRLRPQGACRLCLVEIKGMPEDWH